MKKKKPNSPSSASAQAIPSDDRVLVGEILGAHGVRGLVKIRCHAEDPSLLEACADLSITLKNKHKGSIWLAEIAGTHDKDAADTLKGTALHIDPTAMPDLDEDDGYYYRELIGCKATTPEGQIVGEVIGVENFGASDLLDIQPPSGESFYHPFTKDTVGDVDIQGQRIVIMPMEEL